MLIIGVTGQALIDERYLYSVIASQAYDGSLYYAQMKFVVKTIMHAMKVEENAAKKKEQPGQEK